MDPSSAPDLRVVPVAYGIDAARALHRCVADAKAGDPLGPVTVVVHANSVGVASRRRLASAELGPVTAAGAGIAGVVFLTPYRLAELLGATGLAAMGRRPVSTPVIAAALRHVLGTEPGIFADVADHAATEEALVGAYRELSRISAGARTAVANAGRRAGDVVRICGAARDRLRADWYDEADLVDAACEALPHSPIAAELGTVVVHLPQETAVPARRLLREVAAHRPVVVVAGRTGSATADADVRDVLADVGGPGAVAAFDAHDGDAAHAAAPAEVVTTSDADDEVRAVVRAIVDAARDGIALERIAVLYGTHAPYARLLHEHLGAAGIRICGDAVRPVSERVVGRFLLDVLSLPERGFRRRDVMAVLTGAPVRDADAAYVPATQWQRLSREAGVVGGDDWDRKLAHLAGSFEAEADSDDASDDPNPARSDRLRRDAASARRLRAFVLALVDRLDAAAEPASWSQRAEWAGALVADLLGDENVRRAWPEPERRAADRVAAALSRLAGLDGVEAAAPVEVFRRTLELELDDDLGRVGRQGEGVYVGAVSAGLAMDLDMVCVVGMAEGVLPARVVEDALLSDGDRAAAGGELTLRSQRADVQQRQFLAAIASARRTCLLTFPRGDLRASSERMPSRWLADATGAAGSVREVASFAAGVRGVEFPATGQEYRIRALDLGADVPDPVVRAAAEMAAGRRSAAFTRFDGNLAGLGTEAVTRRPVSASSFQDYVKCPHGYLVGTVLRAAPVADPEDLLEITALDYGNLVHEVLERFVAEAIDADVVPAPGAAWSTASRARLHVIASESMAAYTARGLTGRPLFAKSRERRLHSDLDAFLDSDVCVRGRHGALPVATELAFGLDGYDPVKVDVGGGRDLAFRGRADRVDSGSDGGLVVYDYKTGKVRDDHKALGSGDPVAGGALLQLPLYGLAARARTGRPDARVHAYYWFVTAVGDFETRGYEVTDAVVERFRTVVGAVAGQIDAGVFPALAHVPSYSTFPTCASCDPDGLGTTDTNLAWRAKQDAPELAELRALVEASDGDDG